NYTGLLRVNSGQLFQCFVERQKFNVRFVRSVLGMAERDGVLRAASLSGSARSCVVNQYAAHQLRGDCEEMGAVLPVCALLVNKFQISFVYKRRRLQRMIGALPAKIVVSQTPQFLINKRHQFVQRLAVSLAPSFKKLG